jgi:hypothetical protein
MGLTPDGRLFVFSSLDAIFTFDPTSSGDATAEATRYTEEIPLPPLPTATFRLYALETRLFVHVAGVGMQQLLELVRGEDDLGLGENQHGKGDSKGGRQYLTDSATGAVCGAEGPIAAEDARTRLVSIDIDALSFTIVSGAKNRLGILCDTGEAYLLDSRTRELEALSTGTRQGQPADDTRQASDRESGVKDVRPASPGLSDQAHDGGESDDEDQDEIIALGIGAGSEVLVSASGVWVRGESMSILHAPGGTRRQMTDQQTSLASSAMARLAMRPPIPLPGYPLTLRACRTSSVLAGLPLSSFPPATARQNDLR